VPLTAQQKEELANYLRTLGNQHCTEVVPLPDGLVCADDDARAQLERGTREQRHFDLAKYLAMNVVIAVATGCIIYLLALFIPLLFRGIAALARRYWRWLNT
jgi:hypothetical protein